MPYEYENQDVKNIQSTNWIIKCQLMKERHNHKGIKQRHTVQVQTDNSITEKQ